MQRYGLLRQKPRKAMISSSSCCDNSLDFGHYTESCFFFVARFRMESTIDTTCCFMRRLLSTEVGRNFAPLAGLPLDDGIAPRMCL